MIQNVLRTFGGIDAYGVFSLCLFMLVFCSTVIWALIQKKTHLDAMSRLPLENETERYPSRRETRHEQ
jgi:hypothetical protein